nr:MAG TPA: hypothetical protein [Caudoviricetes sp.]
MRASQAKYGYFISLLHLLIPAGAILLHERR